MQRRDIMLWNYWLGTHASILKRPQSAIPKPLSVLAASDCFLDINYDPCCSIIQGN